MKSNMYNVSTSYLNFNNNKKETSKFYRIILHNDDFTPMEFVLGILEKLLFMDRRDAAELMLAAHTQGRAAYGCYTKDVADSKIEQIMDEARKCEYPLFCSMEAA